MSLDDEKLKIRMDADMTRALTSKTELFLRDEMVNQSVEGLTSAAYREWLRKTRFSHLLVLTMVDLFEAKDLDEFHAISDYYTERDACMVLYKASKVGPKKFYADFARWMACDWAQIRIDSRELDGYKSQVDPPSVQTKLADIARKLVDNNDDETLTEDDMKFLMRFFDDMWCRPLDDEIMWHSACSCPYDRSNVTPHRHRCSSCGHIELKPGELKLCARCNRSEYGKFFKRYYCGTECQKAHWDAIHRQYHKDIDAQLNSV